MRVTEHAVTADENVSQAYFAYRGDYTDARLFKRYQPGIPQYSVEDYLRRSLRRLLHNASRPVVFLDVGAAAATSVLRLSNENEDAIKDGALAMVATNLSASVERFVGAVIEDEQEAGQPTDLDDLYASTKHLVHEITTDFMPGTIPDITLPGGHTLDLHQSVALAHESTSLTVWCKRPRIQIPALGRLIAPEGTYMLPTCDTVPLSAIRKPEVMGAHQSLRTEYGLHPVTVLEAGQHAGQTLAYTIFKGPEAGPVTLQS